MSRHIVIVRRGVLKQKWYARFIADNNLTLARTTEHYWNLGEPGSPADESAHTPACLAARQVLSTDRYQTDQSPHN